MNTNDKEFLVRKIRTQYTETKKEQNELDKLKALDAKVKRPANVLAYIFGSISAIIMGSGMSLVMTELNTILGLDGKTAMATGIGIRVIGIALVCLAYPIYNGTVKKERKKIAPEIIRLTDELMK